MRDVAWSLFNHQSNYTDGFLAGLNAGPDSLGPKMSRPRCDARAFYLYLIETGGVFEPGAGEPYGGDTATPPWPPSSRDEPCLETDLAAA